MSDIYTVPIPMGMRGRLASGMMVEVIAKMASTPISGLLSMTSRRPMPARPVSAQSGESQRATTPGSDKMKGQVVLA
jgi:hypothetical protein